MLGAQGVVLGHEMDEESGGLGAESRPQAVVTDRWRVVKGYDDQGHVCCGRETRHAVAALDAADGAASRQHAQARERKHGADVRGYVVPQAHRSIRPQAGADDLEHAGLAGGRRAAEDGNARTKAQLSKNETGAFAL